MRILIFILLCCCGFAAMGQPRGDHSLVPDSRPNSGYYNMEKYWWYRYRLVNDFMKTGPDCGESIPAQRRNRPTPDHDYTAYLKWADATIDLGNYIAMLATEHRILQNARLNTQRSDMELKYALDAFERLDRNAEAYCADIDGTYPCNTAAAPQQWQNQLNGFFIRDDVPYFDFVPNNREHFNRPGINDLISVNKWSCGAFMGRYWEPGTPGGLRNEYGPPSFTWRPLWLPAKMAFPPRVPSEESQDQVVQLGMGLALAVKTPGLFYAGKDLGMQASDNLRRILMHVASSSGYFGRKWTIMNPATGSCVYGTAPGNDCNAGGAQMYPFAAALSNVLGGYCGGTSIRTTTPEWVSWQAMKAFPNVSDCNFAGTWAALTCGWPRKFDHLEKFAMAHDEGNPHLPYLNRVLFPKAGEWFRVEQTKQLLDAAPDCGIHNYNGTWSVQRNWQTGVIEHNPPKSHHWSGNDLIHEYYHRGSTTDNGDCNGLDFMVLFNLFAIQLGDYFPQGVFNSFYREDFQDRCPFRWGGSTIAGDATTKLKLNFLEYLSARNKVDPDGYLTFRCGKVIDLLPGFETLPKANFQAYVQDYEIKCSTGDITPGSTSYTEDDAYHYAEVIGKKVSPPSLGPRQSSIQSIFNTEGTYSLNGDNNTPFPGTNNDDDSTYYLDFPPDGMPYIPDEAAQVGGDTTTRSETCAEIWAEIDSLKAEIYASGDPELIEYLDSVLLPSAYFPECDSQSNYNYRIAPNNTDAAGFNIYPNPNNGNFTVAFDSKGDYSLTVYNPLGSVIYSDRVYERTSATLQLNGPPPGIYTIAIARIGTPQVQRKKITVVY